MISVRRVMWADWKQSVETCILITDLKQSRSLATFINNSTLQQNDMRSCKVTAQMKKELL